MRQVRPDWRRRGRPAGDARHERSRRWFGMVRPLGCEQGWTRCHTYAGSTTGITVADLDAVAEFFVALGLEIERRTFVEGEFLAPRMPSSN